MKGLIYLYSLLLEVIKVIQSLNEAITKIVCNLCKSLCTRSFEVDPQSCLTYCQQILVESAPICW